MQQGTCHKISFSSQTLHIHCSSRKLRGQCSFSNPPSRYKCSNSPITSNSKYNNPQDNLNNFSKRSYRHNTDFSHSPNNTPNSRGMESNILHNINNNQHINKCNTKHQQRLFKLPKDTSKCNNTSLSNSSPAHNNSRGTISNIPTKEIMGKTQHHNKEYSNHPISSLKQALLKEETTLLRSIARNGT